MRETDKHQYGLDNGTDSVENISDSESIEEILESIHQIIEKNEKIEQSKTLEDENLHSNETIDQTKKVESIEDLLEQKLRFAEYQSNESENLTQDKSTSETDNTTNVEDLTKTNEETNLTETENIENKTESEKFVTTDEMLKEIDSKELETESLTSKFTENINKVESNTDDEDDNSKLAFVNIKENNFSLFSNKDEHSQLEGFIKNIIKNWLSNEGRSIIIHQIEQYVDLYIEVNKEQINKIIIDTFNKANYEKIIVDYTRSLEFQDQVNKIITNQIKTIFKNFIEG